MESNVMWAFVTKYFYVQPEIKYVKYKEVVGEFLELERCLRLFQVSNQFTPLVRSST